MSPRVVSLRTGQTPSQAQKRSGKDGKCTRNCPVERKRVPQKVNCSSGLEGGATRGTQSREYEGGRGFCHNRKTLGAVGGSRCYVYHSGIYVCVGIPTT